MDVWTFETILQDLEEKQDTYGYVVYRWAVKERVLFDNPDLCTQKLRAGVGSSVSHSVGFGALCRVVGVPRKAVLWIALILDLVEIWFLENEPQIVAARTWEQQRTYLTSCTPLNTKNTTIYLRILVKDSL